MKPIDVRILIVDDDAMMVETIAELFKTFRFHVDTASSGNQAWELIKSQDYNLVISDIRMPDGDGIELAKRIKQKNTKTGVLFVSGFSDLLNEEIFNLGVEGIFSKPFDTSAVKKAIESCLLIPEAKWAPQENKSKMILITKSGKSLESLENRKEVIFGRGGFFLSHHYLLPDRGSRVAFKIEILEPQLVSFEGIGLVRWSQGQKKDIGPQGLGIEIIAMPVAAARLYDAMFGEIIAYIPSLGKRDKVKKRI